MQIRRGDNLIRWRGARPVSPNSVNPSLSCNGFDWANDNRQCGVKNPRVLRGINTMVLPLVYLIFFQMLLFRLLRSTRLPSSRNWNSVSLPRSIHSTTRFNMPKPTIEHIGSYDVRLPIPSLSLLQMLIVFSGPPRTPSPPLHLLPPTPLHPTQQPSRRPARNRQLLPNNRQNPHDHRPQEGRFSCGYYSNSQTIHGCGAGRVCGVLCYLPR